MGDFDRAALARRDPKGLEQVLHFPFASYEGTEPEVVSSFATIFTPAAAIGVRYPEAEQAALRRGDPMAGFKIKGVRSRLRVTETNARERGAGRRELRAVRGVGGRRRRPVGLHDQSPGCARAARHRRQGPHGGRLHPLHGRQPARVGDAQHRHHDLPPGPLGAAPRR